jgi:hypothetical protein
MALARIRSLEQLRYQAPGEWGKLLGLDRIPEVRTLRAKFRPPDPEENELIPITAERRWNSDFALIPAG